MEDMRLCQEIYMLMPMQHGKEFVSILFLERKKKKGKNRHMTEESYDKCNDDNSRSTTVLVECSPPILSKDVTISTYV